MPRVNDLTGCVRGRLTVLSHAGSRGNSALWLCRCECGVEKLVSATSLRKTTSCGCSRKGNTYAKRDPSVIKIDGDMALVELTQGKVAVIDTADISLIREYKWSAHHNFRRAHVWYAITQVRCQTVSMHRLILNAPSDLKVDHKDGDGLNNRRSNIRLVTDAQNCFNRTLRRDNQSGFKGVSFHARTGKWNTRIQRNGRQQSLGLFDSPEDAARAYDSAALELFGEFARPNFSYSAPADYQKRERMEREL